MQHRYLDELQPGERFTTASIARRRYTTLNRRGETVASHVVKHMLRRAGAAD